MLCTSEDNVVLLGYGEFRNVVPTLLLRLKPTAYVFRKVSLNELMKVSGVSKRQSYVHSIQWEP